MKLFIKICGVTNDYDLKDLIKLDIDAIGFNSDKNRYVILLDEDDIKIMVKEENLFVEETETNEDDSEETVIQID